MSGGPAAASAMGAGQVGLGAMAPGMVAGATPASMFGPTITTPALGSGMMGVENVVPGVMGLQSAGAGPMAMGQVAQGTGPLLGGVLTPTPETLDKLAKAPLDPLKIMKMLNEKPGGEQKAPHAQAISPAGGRSLGKMQQFDTAGGAPKQGLASFLGK